MPPFIGDTVVATPTSTIAASFCAPANPYKLSGQSNDPSISGDGLHAPNNNVVGVNETERLDGRPTTGYPSGVGISGAGVLPPTNVVASLVDTNTTIPSSADAASF